MRLRYDMSDNYFKHYNESQGVVMFSNDVIKNPSTKIYNYIGKGLLNCLIVFLILLISICFNEIYQSNVLSKILNIISIVSIVLLVLYFLIFILGYLSEKNRKHEGQLVIDKEGIKDISSNGVIIGATWDRIKAIVIKKHTIIIITDSSIYFFINSSLKNRLLKTLEEYEKNILIIDKTK